LPSLEPDTKWRDFLQSARATMNTELLAIKTPIRDDATRERARGLGWSIELIDVGWVANRFLVPIIDLSSTRLGELMAHAGYVTQGHDDLRGPRGFRGSLAETEARIKETTKRRAAAEAALDAALIDDAERARRDAERAELRDALNRLRVQGNSDGSGYVVLGDDDAPRDLATLTPIERKAFEQFDAAERQLRRDTFARQSGQR
jgi:hypothetical protein